MKQSTRTSRAAHRMNIERGYYTGIRLRIILAMRRMRRGIKSSIAAKSGLKEEQVHKRLSDMEKDGILAKTGRVFISKVTGRPQQEWMIVE